MNEQEQSHTHEERDGSMEFKMPDCCGPEVARTMETCCPGSARSLEAEVEAEGARWPSVCQEMMAKMGEGEKPTEPCPMSAMFRKTSGRKGFGLLAMIPGLLLVLAGVAIILEPQILIWLMAGASIVVGIAFLAAATFFRKLAADLQTSEG